MVKDGLYEFLYGAKRPFLGAESNSQAPESSLGGSATNMWCGRPSNGRSSDVWPNEAKPRGEDGKKLLKFKMA